MAISTGARQVMRAYGITDPRQAEEIVVGKTPLARAVKAMGPGRLQWRGQWELDGRYASDALIISLHETRKGTKGMN